jgi:hypothetical protein
MDYNIRDELQLLICRLKKSIDMRVSYFAAQRMNLFKSVLDTED